MPFHPVIYGKYDYTVSAVASYIRRLANPKIIEHFEIHCHSIVVYMKNSADPFTTQTYLYEKEMD